MPTFLAFLALTLLVGACYFIYSRSMARSGAGNEQDLHRFMVANRELYLLQVDHATWDTAMQIAHGDEGVARARYVQLRVEQMKHAAEADQA